MFIKKDPQRFTKFEKDNSPSPASYKKEDGFETLNKFRGKMRIGTYKPKCFVDVAAKKNVSPGPAKHTTSEKALNRLATKTSSTRLRAYHNQFTFTMYALMLLLTK